MVRRFNGKCFVLSTVQMEVINMMILADLYKSRQNLKLQYKMVLQSFLNTICLFWCFSPSNSLLLTAKEDMLLLHPRAAGVRRVKCTVLWPELFQAGCHWALSTELQDIQSLCCPGPQRHGAGELWRWETVFGTINSLSGWLNVEGKQYETIMPHMSIVCKSA